ncbi:hypothetical protein FPOAC2_08242 [Fusarium poae]|uniref:Uncharacterized protein n=1 Tax=Fusarium poae TaxID=36050 RepID=A0A1B8AKQ5_FUSPO|nr:hypothetical protein FPOAC1_008321 [Fusarium poae]KAG8668937.1 hypothetical protein FPOAC1_008321 [Fusarium poae]OBS21169.1 hypothetical protein FPOA_07507 [Fusarium poae]
MVRFTPLAALALVPVAQARFDWLYARDTIAQCPPCTMEGEAQECSYTVTVTEPAGPYETVTISNPKGSYHTVTVTEYGQPGKTVTITQNYQEPVTRVVYVSQGETLNPTKETVTVTAPGKVVTVTKTETSEHVVTKQVNVYPGPENSNGNGYNPGPKTVTIGNGYPAPSADSPGYDGAVVTKIVGGGDDVEYPDDAHTVTVIDDGKVKTLTYTDGHYNTVINTVTLKDGKKIVKTVTAENTNNYVITKTTHEGGKYHTVIVKPEPTVSTITDDNGDYITTIIETPHTYTLTAPIRYGSPSPTDDDCETITRTATYTGQPEVEIIVYDPESGDSTCTKEDGQPCHPDYENDKTGYDDNGKDQEDDDSKGQYEVPAYTKVQSGSDGYNSNVPVYTKIRTYGNGDTYTEVYGADPTGCESFAVSTSIATVYNTVVVTVEPSSTLASDKRVPKKARSPLSVRW